MPPCPGAFVRRRHTWSHPHFTCGQEGILSATSLAALSGGGGEGRDLDMKNISGSCFSFPSVTSLPVIPGAESDTTGSV